MREPGPLFKSQELEVRPPYHLGPLLIKFFVLGDIRTELQAPVFK